jgi:hypothetical protein
MKNLFNPEFYKDAFVSSPDTNTILCGFMADENSSPSPKPMIVEFTRSVDGWEVQLNVMVTFPQERKPNQVVVVRSHDIRPEYKALWQALKDHAYQQSEKLSNSNEQFVKDYFDKSK